MKQRLSGKRRAYATTMKILMGIAAGMTAALVLFLIIYVLSKGLPNLSWQLLSTAPSYLSGTIGIWPDILNTLYIVLATIIIVVPLGVGAAIYLTEYAAGSRIVAVIEYAAETLSGIPSIIYGLVGMLFFCEFFGMQTSLIAGGLDPCYYESSHGDAHHAGELENGAPELPGGRFRPGGRQVAGDPYRSAAGLCGWCYHRVYSFGRAHFGRIGGAAFHGRVWTCAE